MPKTILALIGSIIVVCAMIWVLSRGDRPTSTAAQGEQAGASDRITLFCAASNRAVMEEIRNEYEAETGRRIDIQYGPSQTLLSQAEVTGAADLFLPADDSFLEIAKDKQLVAEIVPIAKMQAGIAVRKGNPKNIHSFEDLLKKENRLVQANPEAAAIAKLTKRTLTEAGKWDALDRATVSYRTTVTDVANDLLVGAADAGIVYDAVLHTYPDLEFVPIDELQSGVSRIAIGVLSESQRATGALHFARYVTAADRGLKHYQTHGFQTQGGDQWSDAPDLTIFAGSMLRPAIEETIVEFEKREGIRVNRVYNGCGILVSQMKGGEKPDAYFACDSEFMNQVTDLFPEPIDVSQNELVILVQKGNPHKVASLRDLGREGLRIGVGHEKQCAMGWITQNTFREGGIEKEVMANVTVQSPTGDMLVNQMRAGSLDAAVVYLSNAAGSAEFLDAVQIQGLECSTATQPWAVAKESKYPLLASRLFEKICSAESQEVFAAEGFQWQLAAPAEIAN